MSIPTDLQPGPELQGKLDECRRILRCLARVVVAFSGGVDSTLLLGLAAETLGPGNVLGAIGISPSLPERERQAARRLAAQFAIELVEVDTSELTDPNYAANPPSRCYYCKRELFTRLKDLASRRRFPTVICGTNTDDLGDFRPGLRAGEELGVRSPLMEARLTKSDIRTASRTMKLDTWDKPSMPCLASRIPYGGTITEERLSRIEQAEYILKDLGFAASRVRDHETLGRIEVPPEALERLVKLRETIVASLKELGYIYVTLDLQGLRSGSMNEVFTAHDRTGA